MVIIHNVFPSQIGRFFKFRVLISAIHLESLANFRMDSTSEHSNYPFMTNVWIVIVILDVQL